MFARLKIIPTFASLSAESRFAEIAQLVEQRIRNA